MCEIIKFYRDKQIIFSIEDLMNNRMNPKQYKILLKLIPLNAENKSKGEDLLHFMDVPDAKRFYHHILKGTYDSLYNNNETVQGNKIPAYKDLKGSVSDNHVQSRILTFYKGQDGFLLQITYHNGRKNPQGAVIPTSAPLKKAYVKLTLQEIEILALELKDYIRNKELCGFKQYQTQSQFKNNNKSNPNPSHNIAEPGA